MLQSKSRLLELNAKLAETLTSKGITATADETTTALVNKVADITSGDDTMLKGLIQRDLTEIVIPDGVTKIGQYAFYMFTKLTRVTIPNSVKTIGSYAFAKCNKLTSVTIPDSITYLGENAFTECSALESIELPKSLTSILIFTFSNCRKIESITIPDNVTTIDGSAFFNCTNLKSIIIPNSIKKLASNAFNGCTSLTSVIVGNGFNANNLNLSASTQFTRETILQWLNALADRTGQTAYKLTIGATNLAKLTEEDILIATNKNWTLA